MIRGLATDGSVRLRQRRLSQAHCNAIGTRVSHVGRRSMLPTAGTDDLRASLPRATRATCSFMAVHLIVDWLAGNVAGLTGGTRNEPAQPNHLHREPGLVTGPTPRRLGPEAP